MYLWHTSIYAPVEVALLFFFIARQKNVGKQNTQRDGLSHFPHFLVMWFSNSVLLSDLYSFLFIFSLLCGRLRFVMLFVVAWLHIVMRVLCCLCRFVPRASRVAFSFDTTRHTTTHTLTWWPYLHTGVHVLWRLLLHLMQILNSHSVILQSRQKGRSQGTNVSRLNNTQNIFFCRYVCVSLVLSSFLLSNTSFYVLRYTFSHLSHIFFESAKCQQIKLLTRNYKNGVLINNGTIKNIT